MKSVYAIKLFLAIVLGALTGEAVARDLTKWHALGREAFLAYQGNRFDRNMADPAPSALHIVGTAVFVVALAAAYELAAFGGAKCISLIAATIREH